MQSIIRSSVAAAAVALSSVLGAVDCPPRTFEYSSSQPDAEIVQIVIDHYGPNDPIIPAQADYDRASTDVNLIRDLLGRLDAHSTGWQPDAIIVVTSNPRSADLICLNLYYEAAMYPISQGSSLVVFPQPVNLLAMIPIYESLPGVSYATVNIYGCGTSLGCCSSSWHYTPLANGTWKWEVTISVPQHPGGCTGNFWVLNVTADGVVSLSPDLNGDDTVDAADLGYLLASWGLCPGGYCPADVNLSHEVDPADLAALLAAWGD